MHVDSELSAYLDGELAPADRTRVEAHLDTCDRCRARLSELRATAALIAALPAPRPSRSLVPRVVERWNWLRPIRSVSAVASGAFLFVFLVTAVARSGAGLGGGAAAPAAFGPNAQPAGAPAATAAPVRGFATPQQVPVPAAAPQATAAADASRSAAAQSVAPGVALQQTPPPKAADAATAAPTPQAPRFEIQPPPEPATRSLLDRSAPSPLSDPLVWLGLAVIAAVAAIVAHWRLRTV